MPDLVERSRASAGTVYRVVELLENEDLLTRTPCGPITDVRRRAILTRWREDYGLAQAKSVGSPSAGKVAPARGTVKVVRPVGRCSWTASHSGAVMHPEGWSAASRAALRVTRR